ncbi:MAG: acyl-CoA reductase [Fulvivirga sp.]|nr:acyl-CoA reductase [Fulvivirga sp.]
MTLKDRIDAFTQLGQQLASLNDEQLEELHLRAAAENPWFTADNVNTAINGIIKYLDHQQLTEWAENYDLKDQQKIVGVVMAGNIPLVGFHDLLCVLMSGNILKAKLSSQDTSLMRFIIHRLMKINTSFEKYIIQADKLKDVDAIIATGSDNSARYFNYYFSKYPHIIRKNRTSVAILTNESTSETFRPLKDDIFTYFGLGCRNVSKLYVPENFDFDKLFNALSGAENVINHHKYSNNYDYNKSIYLVNKEPHLDNGFVLLKPDNSMVSPISVLYYETYKDGKALKTALASNAEKIQCVVSKDGVWSESKPFGQAQFPKVDDYADGVDTMKFLSKC